MNKEKQAEGASKLAQSLYVGVLMSPEDVARATRNRGSELYKTLERWTLCGDVSPALHDVLQAAGGIGHNERITAFTAPSGLHYAVFTHQLSFFQHRFLVPLFDAQVRRCLEEVAQGGGLGYSLAGENEHAMVWSSVLGAREVLPLAGLCGAVPNGQEDKALEEYARLLQEVREPERIPSLVQGSPVRYASVTLIPPHEILGRVVTRYGAKA